jgi:uncharacterized repeat protein (TIGR03803 family)
MYKSNLLFLAVPLALPAQTLTTMATFNGVNGAQPTALIQASDGNYYGTTEDGGSGYGTIFQLTAAGTLTTIYTFSPAAGNAQLPGPDGAAPFALTQGADGNFYGSTSLGGTNDLPYGGGTIFKITPAGVLTTLYSFTMSDGNSPSGSLLQASDGNFYGITTEGGSGLLGTLFQNHAFRHADRFAQLLIPGRQPDGGLGTRRRWQLVRMLWQDGIHIDACRRFH